MKTKVAVTVAPGIDVVAVIGYEVVFSWGELFLSPIGEGVYVVYERDGAPLAPRQVAARAYAVARRRFRRSRSPQ